MVAEFMRSEVERLALPHPAFSDGRYVTISVGVNVVAPQGQEDVHTLLKAADDALYEAKRNGRNRVVSKKQLQSALS